MIKVDFKSVNINCACRIDGFVNFIIFNGSKIICKLRNKKTYLTGFRL